MACSDFVLPADWPEDLGIDPFAPKPSPCGPFVFPQPEPEEPAEVFVRRINYWIATVQNQDRKQLMLGPGQAPVKKYSRVTYARKNR